MVTSIKFFIYLTMLFMSLHVFAKNNNESETYSIDHYVQKIIELKDSKKNKETLKNEYQKIATEICLENKIDLSQKDTPKGLNLKKSLGRSFVKNDKCGKACSLEKSIREAIKLKEIPTSEEKLSEEDKGQICFNDLLHKLQPTINFEENVFVNTSSESDQEKILPSISDKIEAQHIQNNCAFQLVSGLSSCEKSPCSNECKEEVDQTISQSSQIGDVLSFMNTMPLGGKSLLFTEGTDCQEKRKCILEIYEKLGGRGSNRRFKKKRNESVDLFLNFATSRKFTKELMNLFELFENTYDLSFLVYQEPEVTNDISKEFSCIQTSSLMIGGKVDPKDCAKYFGGSQQPDKDFNQYSYPLNNLYCERAFEELDARDFKCSRHISRSDFSSIKTSIEMSLNKVFSENKKISLASLGFEKFQDYKNDGFKTFLKNLSQKVLYATKFIDLAPPNHIQTCNMVGRSRVLFNIKRHEHNKSVSVIKEVNDHGNFLVSLMRNEKNKILEELKKTAGTKSDFFDVLSKFLVKKIFNRLKVGHQEQSFKIVKFKSALVGKVLSAKRLLDKNAEISNELSFYVKFETLLNTKDVYNKTNYSEFIKEIELIINSFLAELSYVHPFYKMLFSNPYNYLNSSIALRPLNELFHGKKSEQRKQKVRAYLEIESHDLCRKTLKKMVDSLCMDDLIVSPSNQAEIIFSKKNQDGKRVSYFNKSDFRALNLSLLESLGHEQTNGLALTENANELTPTLDKAIFKSQSSKNNSLMSLSLGLADIQCQSLEKMNIDEPQSQHLNPLLLSHKDKYGRPQGADRLSILNEEGKDKDKESKLYSLDDYRRDQDSTSCQTGEGEEVYLATKYKSTLSSMSHDLGLISKEEDIVNQISTWDKDKDTGRLIAPDPFRPSRRRSKLDTIGGRIAYNERKAALNSNSVNRPTDHSNDFTTDTTQNITDPSSPPSSASQSGQNNGAGTNSSSNVKTNHYNKDPSRPNTDIPQTTDIPSGEKDPISSSDPTTNNAQPKNSFMQKQLERLQSQVQSLEKQLKQQQENNQKLKEKAQQGDKSTPSKNDIFGDMNSSENHEHKDRPPKQKWSEVVMPSGKTQTIQLPVAVSPSSLNRQEGAYLPPPGRILPPDATYTSNSSDETLESFRKNIIFDSQTGQTFKNGEVIQSKMVKDYLDLNGGKIGSFFSNKEKGRFVHFALKEKDVLLDMLVIREDKKSKEKKVHIQFPQYDKDNRFDGKFLEVELSELLTRKSFFRQLEPQERNYLQSLVDAKDPQELILKMKNDRYYNYLKTEDQVQDVLEVLGNFLDFKEENTKKELEAVKVELTDLEKTLMQEMSGS